MNKRFVLAGGPGAGKTAVLERLHALGYHCAPDVARGIIRARLRAGLSPRPAPVAFAQTILAEDVKHHAAAPADAVSLFERGAIDTLGTLWALGALDATQLEHQLKTCPYNPRVFVFPPWAAIYRTDAERDQTFTEAVRGYEQAKRWYGRCGYQVIEVPHAPVAERAAFLVEAIDSVL